MSTTWRPHPIVRPVAIGVVRRSDQLPVVSVCDDAGAIEGWRPLGGTRADAYRRDSFHFQDGGVDNSAQWIELRASALAPIGCFQSA